MWPGGTQPMSFSSHDVCLCQILDVKPKGLYKVPFLAYRLVHLQEEVWPCSPIFFLAKKPPSLV